MDIETDLRRWAGWARGSFNLGIKALGMFDNAKTCSASSIYPMNDDEGRAFDPAVATLKQIDKELYSVVRLHYIYGLSTRAISRLQARPQSTVMFDLRTSKTFIAGFVCGQNHANAVKKRFSE